MKTMKSCQAAVLRKAARTSLVVSNRFYSTAPVRPTCSEGRSIPKTLVLNADYQPLSTTNFRRSVALVESHKALVVEMSDQFLTSELLRVQCPSVIALTNFVKPDSALGKENFVTNPPA